MIEITFLNVGNADSIAVKQSKTTAIVIDVPIPKKVENWLNDNNCETVSALFFTHDHRDHIPSLSGLITFLSGWLTHHHVERVFLPTGYIKRARATLNDKRAEERFRHALDKLNLWEESQTISIERAERRQEPYCFGDVRLKVLHPSALFAQQSDHESQPNEMSLVLRLEYKSFSAVLLADIEGRGLEKLLDYTERSNLHCNVVKIPHHGAWQPTNATAMRRLLDETDASFAILSVGSRNTHKHVVPRLFQELLKQKADKSKLLSKFVCTEVTRTCVHSARERQQMGRKGLEQPRACAGDIVVEVDSIGQWLFRGVNDHSQTLQGVEMPACLGRADLVGGFETG